ncbi:hypothetical protein COU19_03280 [Candidatus Kaiserbacteria bacterium CG10_big_fil_rev_8_21_14_0_10_56_12]|uniref:Uncharacterized protein n=1 Tax=Candidatus Kaiserbacteria bacterium CG10_big_fil_rev_8_21_14_0_10_56_12 TaxID=1974611 RepID=A0A2H0U963_9BACT|nr:MAG: hypothetical protein COU19_03280 [Candidatus Kaiserbacteria bacterium CG10_big_fil_rev_8_21_14_0_10_56_12]
MIFEYLVASLLVMLLVLLGNPFMFWMPSMMTTLVLVVVAVLVVIYAGLILRERRGDERELLHRMLASRAAYLAGIVVLTIALLLQGIRGEADPWIAATLATMVLAKVVARAWANRAR